MKIIIKINTDFYRNKICTFTTPATTAEEIFTSIQEKLKEVGLANIDENKYYTNNNTTLTKNNILSHISDNTLYLNYINIIAPYGACEYTRIDGMVFFFHTSETPHKNFPHIHIKYSGEEMLIYLESLKAIDKIANGKKKRAIEYVTKNKERLLQEWNKIIQKHGR